jgi:hypothetical protein
VEVDVELEVLRSSVARVWDLVLHGAGEPSSLVTSMTVATELFKNWIDAATANGVLWGSHSALVPVVSHFQELDVDLEVVGSRHSVGLIEDEVDALWS